ncbi:MAG TPA: F0F1 ATP synthase subunit A [Candidatus Polarisedimenticolia bacterium]|nr:F0F1 ATP synthase subunit A [Candidatus Polarisedimenticolia bacterium]
MSTVQETSQALEQAAGAATPGLHGAAAANPEGAAAGHFDAGESIFHHISDSRTLELPFVGEVHLPVFHLGRYDLPITRHVVMMWVACALILLVLWLANRRRSLAPKGIHNVIEMAVVFVRDELARKNIGAHGDRFVSYLLSTFVFILTCNLLGLIPYGATATGNIGVTAGLAGMAFLMIQAAGIREHGFGGHFKNLVPHGMPIWLLPIMIPVEFLGMFTKPFALCVRLFANMTAGHVVILSLISLVFILQKAWVGVVLSVPFSLFINGIELLVAFLQAYIFTMLTSLFIGMSVHPQH